MSLRFNENRATVQTLRRIADTFEQKEGRVTAAELWGETEFPGPDVAADGLRQMDQVLSVLRLLATTYESHICDVRKHVVLVPRVSLLHLPDELIVDILECDPDIHDTFEYLQSDGEYLREGGRIKLLIPYSHVCSRFRKIILSRLKLQWDMIRLENSLDAGIIHFVAHHSGDLGLTVDIYDWPGAELENDQDSVEDEVYDSLPALLEYHDRWADLSMTSWDDVSTESEHLILELCFPSLRVLRVEGLWREFYHGWSMPNLTTCVLDMGDICVTDIVAFLASNPNLTSIDLTFQSRLDRGKVDDGAVEVVDLPSLEHLEIRFIHPGENIGVLVGSISSPSLKHLRCYSPDSFAMRAWKPTPVLNKLSLTLEKLDVSDIISFLASTPGLTNLELKLSGAKFVESIEQEASLPMLESLSFSSDKPQISADEQLIKAISCPALKQLNFHGSIQPLLRLRNDNTSLSTCSLKLEKLGSADIISFLSQNPNLTSLKLTLLRTELSGHFRVVKLALLEKFEFSSKDAEWGADRRVLEAISCPCLTHLVSSFNLSRDGRLEYLDFLQEMKKWYPVLRYFELEASASYRGQEIFFEDVLLSLPCSVEEIVLNRIYPKLHSVRTLGSRISPQEYPKLKVVDIRQCFDRPSSFREDNFYDNIASLLKRSGVTLHHFRSRYREEEATVTLRAAGVLVD